MTRLYADGNISLRPEPGVDIRGNHCVEIHVKAYDDLYRMVFTPTMARMLANNLRVMANTADDLDATTPVTAPTVS